MRALDRIAHHLIRPTIEAMGIGSGKLLSPPPPCPSFPRCHCYIFIHNHYFRLQFVVLPLNLAVSAIIELLNGLS